MLVCRDVVVDELKRVLWHLLPGEVEVLKSLIKCREAGTLVPPDISIVASASYQYQGEVRVDAPVGPAPYPRQGESPSVCDFLGRGD